MGTALVCFNSEDKADDILHTFIVSKSKENDNELVLLLNCFKKWQGECVIFIEFFFFYKSILKVLGRNQWVWAERQRLGSEIWKYWEMQ